MVTDTTSRLIEIWSEGYVCSGNSNTATYHGSVKASSLLEAVTIFATKNPEFARHLTIKEENISIFDKDKEPSISYWGCKVFDNRTDAQKAFG